MSELLNIMEKNITDNLAGPKEKVVIFAEGNADDVTYDNDGLPYVDNTSAMFPTSARDFVKANPQYEYMVVVGKGEDQINKAFQDVNSSKFMDENTRLMVMGHASGGGEFGSEDPGVWAKIIRDNGLRNKFSEVAYGACGQGEYGVCVDLSRAFGENTTVYAQTGQTWGVKDTPNMYLNRLEAEGGSSSLHKRPETFQDAFRTVGSGLMTFKGADREFTPGSTAKTDPFRHYSGNIGQDIPLDQSMDPEAFKIYEGQIDSIRSQYDVPAYPSFQDPKYAQQGKRSLNQFYMKKKVEYEAQKEYWKEKHPDEPLPEDTYYQGNRDLPVVNMPDTDWYDYLDWLDEKEVNAEDVQYVKDYLEEDSLDAPQAYNINKWEVGRNWLGTEVAKRQVDQYTKPPSEEDLKIREEDAARREAYWAEQDRVGGLWRDRERVVESEASAAGINMPPIEMKNYLLDTDKVIDFPTIDDMVNNPEGVVSLYVNDENRMNERTDAFTTLYMEGNEAAENALRVAYNNLDKQGVINEIDHKAQWDRALDLEALRIYSESDEPDFTGWEALLGN